MNALRVLHPLMRQPDFKKICLEEHKFAKSIFDAYRREVVELFNKSLTPAGSENWSDFCNACGSMTVYLNCFPEDAKDFKSIILDLIRVIKDKTEVVRKNGAVLLAKLANDEELNKYIRANHGFDVLMSLRTAFGAQ